MGLLMVSSWSQSYSSIIISSRSGDRTGAQQVEGQGRAITQTHICVCGTAPRAARCCARVRSLRCAYAAHTHIYGCVRASPVYMCCVLGLGPLTCCTLHLLYCCCSTDTDADAGTCHSVCCTVTAAMSTSRPTSGTTDGEFVVTVSAQYDLRHWHRSSSAV